MIKKFIYYLVTFLNIILVSFLFRDSNVVFIFYFREHGKQLGIVVIWIDGSSFRSSSKSKVGNISAFYLVCFIFKILFDIILTLSLLLWFSIFFCWWLGFVSMNTAGAIWMIPLGLSGATRLVFPNSYSVLYSIAASFFYLGQISQ